MPVVTTTLERPDGTALGGRVVTVAQVGGTLTEGGAVAGRVFAISDPITGVVSFSLPASPNGSYYVWQFSNTVEVVSWAFVMPNGAGPYQLADIVTSVLPPVIVPGNGITPEQLTERLASYVPTSAIGTAAAHAATDFDAAGTASSAASSAQAAAIAAAHTDAASQVATLASTVASNYAPLASPALTGAPTVNGQGVVTAVTDASGGVTLYLNGVQL